MKEGALANQKVGDGGKTEPRDTQLAVLLLGARQIEFLNHHSGPTMEAKMFPPPGAPASDTRGEKAEAGGGGGRCDPHPCKSPGATPAGKDVGATFTPRWPKSPRNVFPKKYTLKHDT